MIIKLQPDQVPLFWDLTKHGIVSAYKIPKDFQQDFTLKYLENLLLGNYQCWVVYSLDEEENKRITAIVCSKIVDEKEYGIRTLMLIGVYGFRLITDEAIDEAIAEFEKFALANNCNVIATEYRLKRVEDILNRMGFEKHITVSRKVLT